MQGPHYPIIFIRGYAGTQGEVEDTVADPYMGFNLGSTKLRQDVDGRPTRHVFESPLLRLRKDEGYVDTFGDGRELEKAPQRSLWVFRYYEPASRDLGIGQRDEIETYAQRLGTFIEQVRTATGSAADPDFRVLLVAHSMGGLIVRCYLQKVCPEAGRPSLVDKVFTYATPHGGIEVRGLGHLPAFIGVNQLDTFQPRRMREFLNLGPSEDVRSLGGHFPPERFFCLVGTNSRDYAVAAGVARSLVGEMSDGLVRIENAYALDTPRAFVHRSHSGHYGIVNSEEGYQNLRRFFFGDVRVDALLDLHTIWRPKALEGRQIRAIYHIEVIARVRRARWDLHRRTVAEASAILAGYDDALREGRTLHLASAFLANQARANPKSGSLGFSLDLRVLVPEYEVDGALFLKRHYDGGYLFRDKLNLEARHQQGEWQLRYGWDRKHPNETSTRAARSERGGGYRFSIPVEQATRPGLRGTLYLDTNDWT